MSVRLVVTADLVDNCIRVYHLESGELLRSVNHTSNINALTVFQSDGEQIALATDVGVTFLSPYTLSLPTTHTAPGYTVSIAASPDDKHVAAGSG